MEAITQELARLQESKEKAVQALATALALPPEDRMPDVVEFMKAENAKLDVRFLPHNSSSSHSVRTHQYKSVIVCLFV